VDYDRCVVTVEPEPGAGCPPAHETLMVNNDPHVCNFPVDEVREKVGLYELSLGVERLRIGRFVVDEETEDGLTTLTWIHREWEDTEDSGCHYLIGSRVAYKGRLWMVSGVLPRPETGGHRFVFSGSVPYSGSNHKDPVIYDLGPGDDCVMRPTVFCKF